MVRERENTLPVWSQFKKGKYRKLNDLKHFKSRTSEGFGGVLFNIMYSLCHHQYTLNTGPA